MTPREVMNIYKGYTWSRERLLKDMAWMMANIANTCGYPTKGRRKIKPENFIRPSRNEENHKNPFYLDVMGLGKR